MEGMVHKYEDWELFGRFVTRYSELCGDHELLAFIDAWSHGQWEAIDKEWPEFSKFYEEF